MSDLPTMTVRVRDRESEIPWGVPIVRTIVIREDLLARFSKLILPRDVIDIVLADLAEVRRTLKRFEHLGEEHG